VLSFPPINREGQNSKFDIDFVVENIRYHFGFEATDHEFTREWLYAFPNSRRQKLYERDEAGELTFGKSLKGENVVISRLVRKNSLFISASRQNSHEQLTKISDFFRSIKLCDYDADQVRKVSVDNFDNRITHFFGSIGTGIVAHKIEKEFILKHVIDKIINFETPLENHDDKSRLKERLDSGFNVVKFGRNNKQGKAVYFETDKESSGTRRLLYILGPVFKALDEGSVVVIDEIDASLHTKICGSLLSMFADKSINTKGAQLIATTHDTNLMRSDILRRDQIWFCEKSEFGETHLTPLSDIQTRQTDNIEKGYLDGRFGAIPFSGSWPNIMSRD
jgi:AAA15 family ATPase/GTPase